MKALGLKAGFTLAELKSAFRARAKLCHPDLSGKGGLDFARLRDAYGRLLSYAEAREARASRTNAASARAGRRDEGEAKAARAPEAPRPARAAKAAREGAEGSPRRGGKKASGTPPRRAAAEGKDSGGDGMRARKGPGKRSAPARKKGEVPLEGDDRAVADYREGLERYEAFQSVNRDRALELKFLYSLTKKRIALVDLHRFLRLLDALEENARAAIGLFRRALEREPGRPWSEDARVKSLSLERQLARCRALRAEVGGEDGG